MKTRDLVVRLSSNMAPVERDAVSKRLNRALLRGLAADTTVLVVLYGIHSTMPALILTTMFWARLAFPLAIVATSMQLAQRLGRPGAPFGLAWIAVTLPVATMLAAAGAILAATPPGYRFRLMLGTTWHMTAANIVLVSLPSLAIMMRAMKGLAPTRLVLAGASAGLLAGGQGLLVYSLYCSEMAVPFWGIWYALAIAMTTALGAAAAPRFLRW